jgi:hypothetical protein
MNDQRFEIRLSETRRRELDALAHETGLSATALARLSIAWLLKNQAALRGAVPAHFIQKG